MLAKRGDWGPGYAWNADLWRLGINEAASLEQLFGLIQPYLLHRTRIRDATLVMRNIEGRRLHGTIK